MSINSWIKTWGRIDINALSEEEIKRKIVRFYYGNVDFNMRNPARDDRTPLHYAAKYCSLEVLDLLISCGANPGLRDSKGNTVLHYAANTGKKENIECLLWNNETGFEEVKNEYGKTALHYAAFWGYTDIVRLLCELNPKIINEKDNNGWTALTTAVWKKDIETTTELIRQGANIDDCEELLHYSVSPELKKILLRAKRIRRDYLRKQTTTVARQKKDKKSEIEKQYE